MSLEHASAAVANLAASFRQDLRPESVAAYAEHLADIPPALLEAAVRQVVERNTFFPAVAEIRTAAARLSGLLPAPAPEALALIRRADQVRTIYRRDDSPAYVEKFWDWPEDADPRTLQLARSVLERVGEPSDANGQAYFGWENGFLRVYEAEADAAARSALADLSQARLPGLQVVPMLPAREPVTDASLPGPRAEAAAERAVAEVTRMVEEALAMEAETAAELNPPPKRERSAFAGRISGAPNDAWFAENAERLEALRIASASMSKP